MVDTSSMYNLSNPALNDDIGLNRLNKSLPITPNGFDGEPYVPDMAGVKLQDQVTKDTFDKSGKTQDKDKDKDKDNNDKKDATSSDKQSKSSTVKKALIGGGIATISGILAFKNRGKIMSVTKNLLKKIKK